MQHPSEFPSVIDRYYTRNYLKLAPSDVAECLKQTVGEETGCLDQYYHMHSNKLILFGIAPTHDCLQNAESDPIEQIKFNTEKLDQISGKRKQGAQVIQYESLVCEITTKNQKSYKIRALIKGCKLIEINDRLTPELLTAKPESDGFLAIMMFNADHDLLPDKLLKKIYKWETHLTSTL